MYDEVLYVSIFLRTYNIFILELNTLPGMTGTSLFPKAAKERNVSYSQLIQKIINLGLNDSIL